MKKMKKISLLVRTGLLLLAAILACSSLTYNFDYRSESTEVIALSNDQDLRTIWLNIPLDPLLNDGQKTYFLVEKRYIQAIQEAGYIFTIETEKFIRPAEPRPGQRLLTAGGLNGVYHSYQELASELKALSAAHPTLARLVTIGRSLENRNIYALKISDNPGLSEDEPGIAFLGGHHAREWISVEVPLLIGKYLLENYSLDTRVKTLIDSAEIWIVPLVNPDGLEYSILNYRLWRKNRRLNQDGSYGVDLNRNYSYQWAYDDLGSSPDPSSAVFRGTGPFSEPETEAIRNLFLKYQITAAISYHSFSQLILYPWGYLDQPTDHEYLFQSLASDMAGLIHEVNGRLYQPGRASASLYLTNGDFTDWAYGLFRIPAFTIELPPLDLLQGGFLNPEADINLIFQENLPAALYLIDWAVTSYTGSGARRKPILSRELEKDRENVVKNKFDSAFKGKESR